MLSSMHTALEKPSNEVEPQLDKVLRKKGVSFLQIHIRDDLDFTVWLPNITTPIGGRVANARSAREPAALLKTNTTDILQILE